MVILSLPLIQEEQLSGTGQRMFTFAWFMAKLVLAYQGKVMLKYKGVHCVVARYPCGTGNKSIHTCIALSSITQWCVHVPINLIERWFTIWIHMVIHIGGWRAHITPKGWSHPNQVILSPTLNFREVKWMNGYYTTKLYSHIIMLYKHHFRPISYSVRWSQM